MPGSITVEELPIPDSLAAVESDDHLAIVDIRNAITREYMGDNADHMTVGEFYAGLVDQTYERNRAFIVRDGGAPIAYGIIYWSTEPGTRVSWLEVNVHPDHRNQGVGSALLDRLEQVAREAGRPVAQGGGNHRTDLPGPALASPTGFGALPQADPVVRFLTGRGYALEQVERVSRLHLPIAGDVLAARMAEAWQRAGAGYRIETWIGSTPDRWLDDVAVVMNRMATDAPAGNLEIEEEPWDADRVRKRDALRAASGRTTLVAAVEHLPSGRLVAYSDLSVPGDGARPAYQGDTLVVKEHRGHRLGMIVKLANIQQLQANRPDTPHIDTDNADENRPMLDVNEAVGFIPVAYIGAWKKTL